MGTVQATLGACASRDDDDASSPSSSSSGARALLCGGNREADGRRGHDKGSSRHKVRSLFKRRASSRLLPCRVVELFPDVAPVRSCKRDGRTGSRGFPLSAWYRQHCFQCLYRFDELAESTTVWGDGSERMMPGDRITGLSIVPSSFASEDLRCRITVTCAWVKHEVMLGPERLHAVPPHVRIGLPHRPGSMWREAIDMHTTHMTPYVCPL